MNLETFRTYCLGKPGVTESLPFGDDTLVFKVGNKMFALTGMDNPPDEPFSANLKCEPERATELRDQYPEAVKPGFHMNKTHWNTVSWVSGFPPRLGQELIDHSYDLIVASLPAKVRAELQAAL